MHSCVEIDIDFRCNVTADHDLNFGLLYRSFDGTWNYTKIPAVIDIEKILVYIYIPYLEHRIISFHVRSVHI